MATLVFEQMHPLVTVKAHDAQISQLAIDTVNISHFWDTDVISWISKMVFETLMTGDLSSAALFGAVILMLFYFLRNRRPSGIPPFPATPLPIVGNLFSFKKDSRRLFSKWRKEYGDIFSLYMGSQLVIVLNGFQCMKEALVKNADVFSDRPDMFLFTHVLKGKGIGGTSGKRWKSQRKFALTILRDLGFGRNILEGEILEEVEHLCEYFASKKGSKEDFSNIFHVSTSNVICYMVFGRRFEYDDANFIEFCECVDRLLSSIPNTGLVSCLPFLRFLPGGLAGTGRAIKEMQFFEDRLIKPEIERHFREFDGNINSFISAYIKEIKDMESNGQDATELRENFIQTIANLFIGGTETTATTLKWMVLFFIHFPDAQEKCFCQIRDSIGLGRLPQLKDKSLLPYVEATLAETQRRANIVPLGTFHAVAEDTIFHGFNFPKGVTVMPNLDSVLMDPKVWTNPEDFKPERFLDKDGNFFKPEEFIPFSMGRRVCLGKSLAQMELFLLGAALIQRFDFQQPDDEPLPSLEPVIGITASPLSYKIKAVPRE